MRVTELTPQFVEFVPETPDEGVLYISKKFRTASHLCVCGCRREVVTPLNAAKWELEEHRDGSVSLFPSVGNWSFPCRSHYWVEENGIRWAPAMSERQIAAVKAFDRKSVRELARHSRTGAQIFDDTVGAAWNAVVNAFRGFWRR